MNHRLHLKFGQLERATQHLLAATEAPGPDAACASAPGQWAANQVVYHLLLVENSITGYVQKKLLAAEQLTRPNLLTRARVLLMHLLLRLPDL